MHIRALGQWSSVLATLGLLGPLAGWAAAQPTMTITTLLQEGETITGLPAPFEGLDATVLRLDSVRSDTQTGFAVHGTALVAGQWPDQVQFIWGLAADMSAPGVMWLPLEQTVVANSRWSGESEIGFWLGRRGELLVSQRMFRGQCGTFGIEDDIADSMWLKTPADSTPLPVALGTLSALPGWHWVSMTQPQHITDQLAFWTGVVRHETQGDQGGLWQRGPLGMSAVLMGGTQISGLPSVLASLATVRSYAVSTDAANTLAVVAIAHSPAEPLVTATSDQWLLLNELPFAPVSPVATGTEVQATGALSGETWTTLHALGVGLGSTPVATYWGTTSAAASENEVFIRDNQVVIREGDELGSTTLLGPVQYACSNPSGDILVVWRNAITLNNLIVLKRGDEILLTSHELDGGVPLPDRDAVVTNFLGPYPVAMGSRKGDSSTLLYAIVHLEVPTHYDELIVDPSVNGDRRIAALLKIDITNFGPADCPGDFDGDTFITVPDIFAFLSAWFANDIAADFDGNGVIAVPDIFAFLSAWFAGCV